METPIKKIQLHFLAFMVFAMALVGCGGDKEEPLTDDGPPVTVQDPPKITKVEPASAARGEEVTLTGTDFSAEASENMVKFNGVAATVKSANATQIVAEVPEEATTGPITVTRYNETVTSNNDFEVLADAWRKKADFGGVGRFSAVGFAIDNKGYIGTGEDTGENKLSDFWEYDPAINEWTQKADFEGSARRSAIGFGIGSRVFLGLGLADDGNEKDWWEYEIDDNQWIGKKDYFGGTAYAQGFAIDGKIYILLHGGGVFYEYDSSTNIWTEKNDFPGNPRGSGVGFAINGKGYLGTGSWNGVLADFWEYDPSTDTWTQRADFGGGARAGAVGFALNGKGYIGTGTDWDKALKDFWEYDPTEDSWTRKADFGGEARDYSVGFTIGNRAYIGTGELTGDEGNAVKDFWEYIPD